jgi:signal transduction histidine kinase
MQNEETMIWPLAIFGTILLLGMGFILISFVFLYQKKRFRHQQEIAQLQETFAQEMLHSKAEIQEQTLQYVAAEIHDNFNPTLSVINLNLASVIPAVQEPVKETIVDTKLMVKQLMGEMRTMSRNLSTNEISQVGFAIVLEKYLEYLRKSGVYKVVFKKVGDIPRLSADRELILFRMCQEALNNIVKHADAKNIYVSINYTSNVYTVQINDDGKGFDTAAEGHGRDKQEGSGLRNLRNRAAIIAASVDIQSAPGWGTTITISLN